jgi:subtilase family serine protease
MQRTLSIILLLIAPAGLWAQRDRISGPIHSADTQALDGSLRPAILRQSDVGRVEPDFPLPAMTLLLKPSASQQTDLRQLLEDQQNPASALYHRWLTPEQFAARFGISQNDIAVTAEWLRSQGFTVSKVARSRTWIAFSGAAQEVEAAFRTEIHRYMLGNESHFANATAPSIPTALADIVLGIEGLDDFQPEPANPAMTSSTGVHTLAPDDLATIYDIAPLYQSGIDGTGQKIAVMGSSAFNASALADVAAFRSKFNLPENVPQIVLDTDYPDPGSTSSINEAHLDIEWSGAIARNATILFVYSGTFLHAVQYAVDNNLAPVITMSANAGCESANTSANIGFYQALAQQANAQGITWVNSGSDAGPASCDNNGAALPAKNGLSVRFPASIPEVTAVGGTEFDEQNGTYWAATNTPNGASAISYIPEMVWNDAVALNALWAGGGGASISFPKPAWQSGPGVPDDGARDLPDVALAASFSHDGYYVYRSGAAATTGGTSASTPVLAGILALLNQYVVQSGAQAQPGLGNINPTLYRLANAAAGAFHDIAVGNNIVPCAIGTSGCTNGTMGFTAGPGYDLASGLGSPDVAKLFAQWSNHGQVPSRLHRPGHRP